MNIKLTYDELQKTIDKLKSELTQAKQQILVLKTCSNEDNKRNPDVKSDAILITEVYDVNRSCKTDRNAKTSLDFEKTKVFCNICSKYFKVKKESHFKEINSNIKEFLMKLENNENDYNSPFVDNNFKEMIQNFQSKLNEFETEGKIKDMEIKILLSKLKESDDKNRKLSVIIII